MLGAHPASNHPTQRLLLETPVVEIFKEMICSQHALTFLHFSFCLASEGPNQNHLTSETAIHPTPLQRRAIRFFRIVRICGDWLPLLRHVADEADGAVRIGNALPGGRTGLPTCFSAMK